MPAYTERLLTFQETLNESIDLAFLPLSADLQYLTGVPREFPTFGAVMHPGAWLEGAWLTPDKGPVLTLPRMTAEFGGLSIVLADMPGAQVRVLGDFDDPKKLVMDILGDFILPEKPHIAISDRTEGETVVMLNELLPGATFHSATRLLRAQRAIKSAEEIEIMRRAGAITEAAFADVIPKLRHGMTELDIMTEVDYQLKRHGAFGPSFTTALYNAGPNHPLIFGKPETKWHRELQPPVSILFDFGAILDGYCYDFGRTVSFGQPDAEFEKVYHLVMASQAAGINALKADLATATEADAAARKVIKEAGYGEAFRHRLGHGIGLDVHEPPFLTADDHTVLREGMLFTVEPSIMLFDKCSARVEDVVVVRPDGGEPLTTGFQTLIVVD